MRLDDGRRLDSLDLIGAVLSLALPGGTAERIRIDAAIPDPDDPSGTIVLHHLLRLTADGAATELCPADAHGAHWSFPLQGQWDAAGHWQAAGFTLACATGAQGKCMRFGYRPWATGPGGVALAPYHAACVRAVRADYCGDRATTRDGQLIDIYDDIGIQQPAPTAGMPFEAAFTPAGAACVAHPRVPANVTLDALLHDCGRLAGRLGTARCSEADARAAADGQPLIFIRSPIGATVTQPPRATLPGRDPANASPGHSNR